MAMLINFLYKKYPYFLKDLNIKVGIFYLYSSKNLAMGTSKAFAIL
jgi:hypothetical protein